MRGCLGIVACVLALLWSGVAHADSEYIKADVAQVESEPVEVISAVEPDVPTLIVDAARRWGLDERVLLRIAWCESRFNPDARGAAGLAGVFQFAPITWGWVAERAGYPGASPYNPQANIEAAAYLYKTEGPKHWGCK